MASELWEAAKAGNTAGASRLLDAGAPVDWKNVADVSSGTVGTLRTRCREDRVYDNQHGVILPQVGLLRHGPRGKTCGPSTEITIGAVAKCAAGWLA